MVRLGVAVDVTALVFGCVVANLVGMASTMETVRVCMQTAVRLSEREGIPSDMMCHCHCDCLVVYLLSTCCLLSNVGEGGGGLCRRRHVFS